MRDIWENADGAAGGPDDYSIVAVVHALAARGVDLPTAFTFFAAANRLPGLAYSEGAANNYPTAPPAGSFKLSKAKRTAAGRSARSPISPPRPPGSCPGPGCRRRPGS